MELGQAIYLAANSKRAGRMILRRFENNDMPIPMENSRMWMIGGCGVLAEAIKMVVPGAQVLATKMEQDTETRWARYSKGDTQHVFVRIGSHLYDAEGETTPEQMRHSWFARTGVVLGNAFLVTTWPEDIYRDQRASKYMAGLIQVYLNGEGWKLD